MHFRTVWESLAGYLQFYVFTLVSIIIIISYFKLYRIHSVFKTRNALFIWNTLLFGLIFD